MRIIRQNKKRLVHSESNARIPLVLSTRTATSELPTQPQRGEAAVGLKVRREGGAGERARACMRTCGMILRCEWGENRDIGREVL